MVRLVSALASVPSAVRMRRRVSVRVALALVKVVRASASVARTAARVCSADTFRLVGSSHVPSEPAGLVRLAVMRWTFELTG